MTRLLLATFCMTALASARLVSPPQEPAKDPPRLEFESVRRDFGNIEAGSDVAHDFVFRVMGEGAIAIRRLHVSCGCTVPGLTVGGERYEPGTPIPSGTEGRLRVKLKTLDGEARRNSTITLYTDQAPFKVELSVTGYVEPFFNLSPAFVNFEEVLQGQAAEREVVITPVKSPSKLELGAWGLGRALRPVPTDDKGMPTITGEEMKAREHEDAFALDPKPEHLVLEPEVLEAGAVRVKVQVRPGLPEGPFLFAVRYETNLGLPVNFRVQGVIIPKVATEPSSLLAFGLLRRGTSAEKEAKVLDRDPERTIVVESVELAEGPAEHLQVTWDAEGDDAIARIHVKVLESMPRGAFQGVLRIRTNHPEQPVRELRLSGFAR